MLGVTGILVGTVFLASIFMQTVLGFSALRTGLAFLPFALAITAGTVVARHLLAHLTPRAIAAAGLVLVAGAAVLLSTAVRRRAVRRGPAARPARAGPGRRHGLRARVGDSMTGIPDSHAGVASGFLMTGHEIGAALGVAVLSAVASTAGSLATHDGAVDGFSRGLVGAAVIAALFAVFALVRMPATRAAAGAGMHLH